MSLSLVLPCYNVMKYLPKCLDSIFKNDCSDIEIVLVNDGSSDDIGGGLSQYFNKNNCDHNIEFEYKGAWIKIIHTRNCGVSAARNTGIENATSDYIVFIDPDDTVKENYFSTIKAFMTSTSVDVAILGFYQIVEDKDGNVVKEGEVFPQKNYISNSVEETVRTVLPKYLGVSWTLAVIFVFYMLFPFFCFLIGNKKRAWGVAVAALMFNWLCSSYFSAGRGNIVYDAIYFIAGGLVFLYRKELVEFSSKHKVIAGAILLIATVVYFAVGGYTLMMLLFCVAALIYTIGCNRRGVLVNPIVKFLGGISFEIYLCHMVIYRVFEKLHLGHLFGNGLLAYIFTAVAVICGSVVFSVCAKWFLNKIETFLKERVRRVNHV